MTIDDGLIDRLADEADQRFALRGEGDRRRNGRRGSPNRLFSFRFSPAEGWSDVAVDQIARGAVFRIAVPAIRLPRPRLDRLGRWRDAERQNP